jgi:crotonobetainyl-CoA:carnitine CoA-transferase CaiB-like acyl-CoA transferase
MLEGVRVVELVDERTIDAGRMLRELGADVVVVEPPGGSSLRRDPPFAGDERHRELCLRWWAGSVGKRSVVIDLDEDDGQAEFARLVAGADVVLEGRGRGLDADGLGWDALGVPSPTLIWVSITSYGRDSARAADPATDLTLLAGGGPMWSCGYDDHDLPPIRGGGNQAFHIGAWYAAIGALVALVHRDATGRGQLVDVSINAACNITCEQTTYHWLLLESICRRQTGRHASPFPTAQVQVRCADGRFVTTGVPPRTSRDFARLHGWLSELGLLEQLPEAVFLELAASRDEPVEMSAVETDPEAAAIMTAARAAMTLIAQSIPAYDFYVAGQERGFAVGAVMTPDEAFEDPHFVARGFQVEVDHPDLGATYRYPGVAMHSSAAPYRAPRRPPHLGEHSHDILGSLPEPQQEARGG